MAGKILINFEEMDAAALELDNLERELDALNQRMNALNGRLQLAYEGESARAFDSFVNEVARPNLLRVEDMCRQTALGIRRTLSEFDSADTTLSGTFAGR